MLINVGVDFGTCYTKVAFFDTKFEKHYFYVFNEKFNDLNRYIFPTRLKINPSGRIFFAPKKNLIFGGDKKYELFKINMEETTNVLNLEGTEYSIDDYKIVAIYCSHVLSKVRNFLKSKFDEPELIFNFGIPLDHLGDQNKKREQKFKLAFNLAEMLSRDHFIDNADRLLDYLPILEELEIKYKEIDEAELKVAVYPETIAGVATLLSTGSLSADVRYSIVDIGAGTTDTSFFEFTRNQTPGGKFHIYNSKTYNIGAENYLNKELENSISELKRSYKLAFGNSYSLDHSKWSDNFNLLFLGGGSRGELREFLNKIELLVPNGNLFKKYINPMQINITRPENIKDSVDKNEESWQENFDILSIAYGLSYPSAMMPRYNPQVPERQRDILQQTPHEPLTPDVG